MAFYKEMEAKKEMEKERFKVWVKLKKILNRISETDIFFDVKNQSLIKKNFQNKIDFCFVR